MPADGFDRKGTFSLNSPAHISALAAACRNRLTGMFVARRKTITKNILLQSGRIAMAISNQDVDRLENVMVRMGKLNKVQALRALTDKTAYVHLPESLLQLGYVSFEDLVECGRIQV